MNENFRKINGVYLQSTYISVAYYLGTKLMLRHGTLSRWSDMQVF